MVVGDNERKKKRIKIRRIKDKLKKVMMIMVVGQEMTLKKSLRFVGKRIMMGMP